MIQLTFTVDAKPQGYSRDSVAWKTTPHYIKEWRKAVVVEYQIAARKLALDGSRYVGRVGLLVNAYGTKGDWDNIGKEISDALKGVAFKDDCQVVSGQVYFPERVLGERGGVCSPKETPKAEVTVFFMDGLKGVGA